MSIFVSIASFRDQDCSRTLQSVFENAKNPAGIIVGLCEQNEFLRAEEVCKCCSGKWEPQIRRIRLHHTDARGPTYARHLCASLWNGEKYFLQLDSHMRLVKNWDEKLVGMLKKLQVKSGNPKIILSTYAGLMEDYDRYARGDKDVIENSPRICQAFLNERGLVSLHGAYLMPNTDPMPNAFVAGGMLFCPARQFLEDVPFDPWLKDVFVSEEILVSSRAWTHGWDIYTPSEQIVFHEFTRAESPKYWALGTDDSDGVKRVKYILGLRDDPGPLSRGLDRYGLGKVRSIEDYWKFAGIDPRTGKVTKNFCQEELFPDPVDPALRVQQAIRRRPKKFLVFMSAFVTFAVAVSAILIFLNLLRKAKARVR